MYLLHNFQTISEEDFSLSYHNRAFQYNDGLFDTLIMDNGRVRFLPDHLERIQQAMQVLQLNVPTELEYPETVEEQIQKLAVQNNLHNCLARVKVHIWRASGGLFTPEQNIAETLITMQPQAIYSNSIPHVDFATSVHNAYSPLSFFKGPYAPHYVLASLEKKKKQLDELILLDGSGHVSEALTANIFWIKDNVLYTPALTTGCIAGIVRKNIFKIALAAHITIKEGFFEPTEVLGAEVAFLCNVTGLRFIQFIQHTVFGRVHPISDLLTVKLFTNTKN